MKILSIGNSFSEDAQRYLHKIASANGENIKAVNLYIGGCSLKTHYYNMLEDAPKYHFTFNGEYTGIYVSIKQALMSDDWDYITLQQASFFSNQYETYQPYLDSLVAYIKKYCPHSKLLIHQTWAYQDGSTHLANMNYDKAADMFADIKEAYNKAKCDINADGLIPCGEVFIKAAEYGIKDMHNDDMYHANRGIGRYALALTWYTYLTKENPFDVKFNDFDIEVSEEEILIAKRVVSDILK